MQDPSASIYVYNKEGGIIGAKRRDAVIMHTDIVKIANILLFKVNSAQTFITNPYDSLWSDKWEGAAIGMKRENEMLYTTASYALMRELDMEETLDIVNIQYHVLDNVKFHMGVYIVKTNRLPTIDSRNIKEAKWASMLELDDLIQKNECTPTLQAAIYTYNVWTQLDAIESRLRP